LTKTLLYDVMRRDEVLYACIATTNSIECLYCDNDHAIFKIEKLFILVLLIEYNRKIISHDIIIATDHKTSR
jgi:hypothetical protein